MRRLWHVGFWPALLLAMAVSGFVSLGREVVTQEDLDTQAPVVEVIPPATIG